MKFHSLFLSTLLFIAFNVAAQYPRNCSQILASDPVAPSGVYTIDPDGEGQLPAMDCYCDMTTDGGGWTLILNYNHLSNTNPALKILSSNLPILGETTLGIDESNTAFWGHADTALMNAIPFDEVRFYGLSSEHSRVIHFKSSHPGTVSYFKTGIGSTEGISTSFTALSGHTSYLPASIDFSVSNRGNYAMTDYPLWTGSLYHWYLAGYDSNCSYTRWEADDYPCSSEPSTLHQIWVRQKDATGWNEPQHGEMRLKLWPNPASGKLNIAFPGTFTGTATINLHSLTGLLLYSGTMGDNPHTIDVSDFSAGIYLLVVRTEEGSRYQQFTIQR